MAIGGTTVVGGFVEVFVDSIKLAVKSQIEVMHGTPTVTEVNGASGPQGVKSAPTSPRIKFTTTDRVDVDVIALLTARGVTVFARKPNGKGLVLANAVAAGEGRYTSDEGELELEYIGETLEEVT